MLLLQRQSTRPGCAWSSLAYYLRATYEAVDEETRACLTPRLETHRDMMYERHIALPLDF